MGEKESAREEFVPIIYSIVKRVYEDYNHESATVKTGIDFLTLMIFTESGLYDLADNESDKELKEYCFGLVNAAVVNFAEKQLAITPLLDEIGIIKESLEKLVKIRKKYSSE